MVAKVVVGSLAVVLLIGGAFSLSYQLGKKAGSDEVRQQWDASLDEYNIKYKRLEDAMRTKEELYSQQSKELSDALQDTEQKHAATLDSVRTDLTSRLQQSESRASAYRSQANGSSIERDRLAKHASELDRTLEQGRSLVRELRETIRFREATIQSLSNQIELDRTLYSSSGTNGQHP